MHNIKKILTTNLNLFFKNAGIKISIIGISGGIDSALTLAIAVNALGKENVKACLLPYRLGEFSSQENFSDAKEICKFFHLPEENIFILPIDDYVKPYEKIFSGMALGNTLARIRMTILFGFANTFSGLVLGTCNKSEVMLGYETKFGDGACDVNVLGNLWKSQVYALASEYNIPEKFITKTPSAELLKDHSDEEELGFTYNQCQPILEIIEKKGEKFSPKTSLEKKIFGMWEKSNHKRIFPPVLSIKKV